MIPPIILDGGPSARALLAELVTDEVLEAVTSRWNAVRNVERSD